MTYSLSELTNRMQGKSITLGWDAVVFMNRAKVNSLLEQQYITRFNKTSFLKQIFGAPAMTPDGGEVLELSGLILSHPRLSFEEASLRDSRVTATMDIVSGTVSYVRKGSKQSPAAILYSYVVSAHQGYTVTMDINLAASAGTVNEQGQVTLDIGDGYNCRCNLVDNSNSQVMLGDFFKALFLEQKPEDRVYTLGMLDLRDVDLLAPRSFQIRTMATEEGKVRTSDDYGDGAVVLLVRTKGNPKEGDDPSDGALDYLIPNDRDNKGKAIYSGALVLSSRIMFDWYIQFYLEEKVGNFLRFERGDESNYIARSLMAISGGFDIPGTKLEWSPGEMNNYRITNVGPYQLEFKGVIPDQALSVDVVEGGRVRLKWDARQEQRFNLRLHNWFALPPERNFPYSVYPSPKVYMYFDPVVDPFDNSFVLRLADDSRIERDIDLAEYHALPGDIPHHFEPGFRNAIFYPIDKAFKIFEDIQIPQVSVLAISNLLFPERNALQLTEARMPGDLALFGHIDPKETTFTLDPLMPVIKAGAKQTFTIRQLGIKAANVTWSVRSVDGARALGCIDANGEFTAPDVQLLEGTAARNVVTATYTDAATGKMVTASALVTIVMAGLVVTPSMTLIDMSDRKSVHLKATMLGAGTLKWTPRSNVGTLVPDGNEATYTPPQTDLPDGALQAVLFDVENTTSGEKTVATVLLRQGNFAMNVSPAIHPGLRANGSALLTASGNAPLPPEELKWEVVAGEGYIDPLTGIFTAPSLISAPYSVVKVSHEGDDFDTLGYSIIHLSEHARQSTWIKLDTFDFVVEPTGTKVWANGLQQAKVTVRVRPVKNKDSPDAELSPSEKKSIRLVSADEKSLLPEVGEGGVPEGGKWHYTEEFDEDFLPIPGNAQSTPLTAIPEQSDPSIFTKEFYVQCHKIENLVVSAYIRSDSYESFYSNPSPADGEHNRKALNLIAIEPPLAGPGGQNVLSFGEGPIRVEPESGGDDESTLNSTDYYFLRLTIRGVETHLKKIEFVGSGNCSMVKWESPTLLEDVYSITGYAINGDLNDSGERKLHIDEILLRRISSTTQVPEPVVLKGHSIPEGMVLFSLHRREYWRYDKYAREDFQSDLYALVTDAYGNKHKVTIGFDGNNRNKLRIIGS